MKKMMVLVGLLALAVLVVSCAREGAVAGEAIQVSAPIAKACKEGQKCGFVTKNDLTLECKSFGNIGTTHSACQAEGYDTCAGGTIIARVSYEESSNLFTFPIDCETEFTDDLVDSLILENLEIDPRRIAGDTDSLTTCCRIR